MVSNFWLFRFWPWMTCKRSCGALVCWLVTLPPRRWRVASGVICWLLLHNWYKTCLPPLQQKCEVVYECIFLQMIWKLLGWRNDRNSSYFNCSIAQCDWFFQYMFNRFSDFSWLFLWWASNTLMIIRNPLETAMWRRLRGFRGLRLLWDILVEALSWNDRLELERCYIYNSCLSF